MRLGGVLLAVILTGGIGAVTAPAQVGGNTVGGSNQQTFTAIGTFGDGSTLSGSLIIDTGLGSVISGDLFVTPPLQQFEGVLSTQSAVSYEFNFLSDGGFSPITGVWASVNFRDTSLPGSILQMDLDIPGQSSLTGYSGGPLCTFDFNNGGPCGNFGAYYTNYSLFAQGQLPPANGQDSPPSALARGELDVAAAPEPASVLLLAGPALWVICRQRRYASRA